MERTTLTGHVNLEKLKELISQGEIETVIVAFTDIQGRLMGKRVTGDFFVEKVFEEGIHFCNYLLGTEMDMSTPSGFKLMSWEQGYGDWIARCDLSTLRIIPWLEKTALVLTDVVFEDGKPVSVSPRQMLKRQLEKAKNQGFSVKTAAEFEFYLIKDSYDESRLKNFHDLDPYGWYNEDYHLLQGTKGEPIFRQIRQGMKMAGIPIETSKGEAGLGQHEANIKYAGALESADRAILFKHGCKEIAIKNGYSITFMAKPDHKWTGSSGHLHISLWDSSGNNLFYDPNKPNGMSDTICWFLGGLRACARELSIFFAPNVNSYKRYAEASWAPVNLLWSVDNRTCGFRIVGHGSSLRIENRIPGADFNPYLGFAAMIAAGLYGLEHKIDPGLEYNGNAYAAVDAESVPRSLYEAISLLENSKVARKLFGTEVVEHYVQTAKVEQNIYNGIVSCWERERYFERG